MRGRYNRRDQKERRDGAAAAGGAGLCPPPGETPAPGFAVQDAGGCRTGTSCSIYDGDKIYPGVRVRMPVRDLLRNIRQSQGWEPQDFQEKGNESNLPQDGEIRRKRPTKSLEELAIIIEVLEEDLRTSNTYSSPHQSWSPSGAGYNSDESDEMIPSLQSYMTYSPSTAEYWPALSSADVMQTSLQPSSIGRDCGRGEEWFDPQRNNWNSSAFFWTQLQKEESQLKDISDAALLAPDGHGRTALHKAVCVGKRALCYAIAKRMASLNSLDLKDSDGMTALLHAAKHNHHLMVADLIHLGASVNETNNTGKSCLHLSAEKGYVRVLEVLKHSMMDGVYVDVEATDHSGMSVLQCASVTLKATVRELESSKSPSHTRLNMLCQEQMMETLECLLQMGSYLHTMRSQSMQATVA